MTRRRDVAAHLPPKCPEGRLCGGHRLRPPRRRQARRPSWQPAAALPRVRARPPRPRRATATDVRGQGGLHLLGQPGRDMPLQHRENAGCCRSDVDRPDATKILGDHGEERVLGVQPRRHVARPELVVVRARAPAAAVAPPDGRPPPAAGGRARSAARRPARARRLSDQDPPPASPRRARCSSSAASCRILRGLWCSSCPPSTCGADRLPVRRTIGRGGGQPTGTGWAPQCTCTALRTTVK